MMPELPDYTIVRELGSGATATVYLAVQDRLNRRVALKVMSRALSADRAFGERFLREGRIVAKLAHPNIVPVYDVGEHDGMLYMAMEYLAGGSLGQRGQQTLGDALESLRQIGIALEYAHSRGFVHRDVKPDNILFRDDGGAMLADFGVARATESLTRMTVTGAIVGTPAYMSPEQVSGVSLDGRADLYSIGIVLYELLAGHRPFAGDSVMSVGLQHITAPVPKLPRACARFQPVIDRLLSKKPDERYASAAEFVAVIDQNLSAPAIPLETPLEDLHGEKPPEDIALSDVLSRSGSAVRSAGRGRRIGAAAVGLLAVAVGGAWWLTRPAAESPILETPTADLPADGTVPVQNTAPDPAIPPADPVRAELARLLSAARAAERDGRWLAPPGENAAELLAAAIALDPDDAEAVAELEALQNRVRRQLDSDIDSGRIDAADELLTEARRAWPDAIDASSFDDRFRAARQAAADAAASATRQRELSDALALGDRALRDGRLTAPAGDSALDHYRAALSLDDANALAAAGIASITEQILTQAEQASFDDDFDAADALLGEARQISPDNTRIGVVAGRVAARREQFEAEAARIRAEEALALRVADLETRIGEWSGSEQRAVDEAYEGLYAETAALIEANPGHATLLRLRTALDEAREAIESGQDDADESRFNLPVF